VPLAGSPAACDGAPGCGEGVCGGRAHAPNPLPRRRESAEKTRDLEEKELRNGRLAMVAFAGFLAQHQVRRPAARRPRLFLLFD
jgi:hypothetical protein